MPSNIPVAKEASPWLGKSLVWKVLIGKNLYGKKQFIFSTRIVCFSWKIGCSQKNKQYFSFNFCYFHIKAAPRQDRISRNLEIIVKSRTLLHEFAIRSNEAWWIANEEKSERYWIVRHGNSLELDFFVRKFPMGFQWLSFHGFISSWFIISRCLRYDSVAFPCNRRHAPASSYLLAIFSGMSPPYKSMT